MKILALILLATLARPATAVAIGKKEPQPDFQVEVNPDVYPVKEFAGKGVKTGTLPPRKKRPDALPEHGEREAVFARVPGLASDVAGMDELDRDLLFVRAKNYTLEELASRYPKIDVKRLRRLQKEITK